MSKKCIIKIMKKATLKTIAEKTGYDISTISRALRDDKRIGEKTREKIKNIAKRLNYIPDLSARILATKKSGIIGIILPDVSHIFYAEIFQNISKLCLENHYIPELFLTEFKKERIERINNLIIAQKVEGVIMAYHFFDFPSLKYLPTVLIDVPEEIDKKVDEVLIDNFFGSYEAVKYLISLGHKRICFVSDNVTTKKRYYGYKKALQESNINIDEKLVFFKEGESKEIGYKVALKILKTKNSPSAFFCANDLIAIGVMKGCFEIGKKVPEDVSIIGFDDISISSYLPVPLTTIKQPIDEIAKNSFYLLTNRIEKKYRKIQKIFVKPTLIIRKSTAPFKK